MNKIFWIFLGASRMTLETKTTILGSFRSHFRDFSTYSSGFRSYQDIHGESTWVVVNYGTIDQHLSCECKKKTSNPDFPPIQKQVNHTLPSYSQYDSRLIILWTIKVYGSRLTILWTYMVQSMIRQVP